VERLLHGGAGQQQQLLDGFRVAFCVASGIDPVEKGICRTGHSMPAWKEKNPGVPRSDGHSPGECWSR